MHIRELASVRSSLAPLRGAHVGPLMAKHRNGIVGHAQQHKQRLRLQLQPALVLALRVAPVAEAALGVGAARRKDGRHAVGAGP